MPETAGRTGRWWVTPLGLAGPVLGAAAVLVWLRYGEWTPMFHHGGHQAGLTIIIGALFNLICIAPCLALQIAAYVCVVVALGLSPKATAPFYVAAGSAAVTAVSTVALLVMIGLAVASSG